MLHVYTMGAYCASINKLPEWQLKAEHKDTSTPWLLLHHSGRVDRFPTLAEAKADALKIGPRVEFRKS